MQWGQPHVTDEQSCDHVDDTIYCWLLEVAILADSFKPNNIEHKGQRMLAEFRAMPAVKRPAPV